MRRTVVLVVGGLVGVICLQNWEATPVRVLFWQIAEVPKLILLGGTFGMGILLGWGWARWEMRP